MITIENCEDIWSPMSEAEIAEIMNRAALQTVVVTGYPTKTMRARLTRFAAENKIIIYLETVGQSLRVTARQRSRPDSKFRASALSVWRALPRIEAAVGDNLEISMREIQEIIGDPPIEAAIIGRVLSRLDWERRRDSAGVVRYRKHERKAL